MEPVSSKRSGEIKARAGKRMAGNAPAFVHDYFRRGHKKSTSFDAGAFDNIR
ncbi:MAG TPA: hypothetical protein VFR70_04535 [Flavobacterium sp.]|nr:hypothetical protein [Flavobacterium sp.]